MIDHFRVGAKAMWRPFSNGTQFLDWRRMNCAKCIKGYDNNWHCEIELAIDLASLTNGYISDDIAERMGKNDKYLWDCPEKVEKGE